MFFLTQRESDMKFTKLTLLGFATICALLTGCSNCKSSTGVSSSGQEISLNIEGEPATLDGRKARLLSDFNLIRTLNEGLFRINKEGITSKAIAENVSLSNDGKTYTITLQETLWSNGDPLTAHDFIYSWKSSLDKNFPAPNASFLFPIKNAAAIKEGFLPMSMLGASAKDDYTIVVELESELPFFTELLALPIYFPVNESLERSNPTWASDSDNHVCNGPFKIQSWKHKNEIIVEKNNRYWDKNKVRLQKLTMVMVDQDTAFSLYQNKELQLVGSPYSKIPVDAIPSLEAQNALRKGPFLGTYWIRTNVESFPLQNKHFRKSLASSIDRKSIIEHVLYGTGDIATGIVPTSMGLQEEPYFTDGDTEEAQSAFKVALRELSISSKNLPELTLTYKAESNNDKIAAAIQDQWRKTLGIILKLEPLEHKVYIDRISKGDYQLACGSWIADFKDPINFLEVFKTKAVGTNNTGWESPNYIEAIESTYKTMGTDARREALVATEQMLLEDMPVIPIYHYNMIHLQDENLKDVVLSDTGNIDFKWAYVSK